MTTMTTMIDSDRTGPDPQIPGTTPDEDFLIKAGVTVRSTGSTEALPKGGAHDLTVEGALQGTNYGAVLGDTSALPTTTRLSSPEPASSRGASSP